MKAPACDNKRCALHAVFVEKTDHAVRLDSGGSVRRHAWWTQSHLRIVFLCEICDEVARMLCDTGSPNNENRN